MTVLVTGATGFVGSHLVRRLAADGHAVRILARSSARAELFGGLGVDVVLGDVTDSAAVNRAVAGIEVVYHLAGAFQGVKSDAEYRQVNVEGTRHVVEAALHHRVQRLVHCSTCGVHGPTVNEPITEDSPLRYAPWNLYEATKAEGEQLVLRAAAECGLSAAVVRPAVIYGPGDLRLLKLFRAIAKRRFVMLGSGRVRYHLVYVEDVVEGLLACAAHPRAVGEAFLVAGPECPTLNEVVAWIAGAVGVPRPRWHMPVGPVYAAGFLCEQLCKPLKIAPPLHRRRVEVFRADRAFDISKARRMLGYEPQVDARTGIERTAVWYREGGLLL